MFLTWLPDRWLAVIIASAPFVHKNSFSRHDSITTTLHAKTFRRFVLRIIGMAFHMHTLDGAYNRRPFLTDLAQESMSKPLGAVPNKDGIADLWYVMGILFALVCTLAWWAVLVWGFVRLVDQLG